MAFIGPPIVYPDGDGPPFFVGDTVVVQATVDNNAIPTDTTFLQWVVRDPSGVEHDYSGQATIIPNSATIQLSFTADAAGQWYWKLTANGGAAQVLEDNFEVTDDYSVTDPTDLWVLVPRARRYCEGPYGAPEGKQPLQDDQLYEMCADALGDIILAAGANWWNKLTVTSRDKTRGYPTGWATECVLDEWEAALITTQVALNYYFHLFRDMKTSVTIANEGTQWGYTLSANVLRDFLAQLQGARDAGLEGLRKHHPTMDQFASTLRVRDPATVGILEWWSNNPYDLSGVGLPGGQEAAVIPWTPGWSGAGFNMGG